jgi:tRNA(adenine34) deaminase
MSPAELVTLAIEAAEEGLGAGELPIGAVVVLGDEVIGRAYARERTERRRLVHADQLALEQADRALGLGQPRRRAAAPASLWLGINLEPCLMCLGTAMVLGVDHIYYGLEAPSDGAAGVRSVWRPARPDRWFSEVPPLTGGVLRDQCRDQFVRYVQSAPESGFRTWATGLAALPALPA